MRLWGRDNSFNVRKVRWCLAELGLSYEHIPAGGAHGLVDGAQFRALNPNGLVPCLEDDGLVLWESNTIVRYLARQYGAEPFAPADPRVAAMGEKWMDWTSTAVALPFRDVFGNLVRRAPADRDMAAVEKGAAEMGQLLAMADTALSALPYLSGEALGVGDIPLGSIAHGWFNLPIERPAMPALEDWYERLTQRPAYQTGVMTPLT